MFGAVDAGNIPEEYYSYLENWYRSQVTANTGLAPSSPFSLHQVSSSPSSLPSTSVSSPSSSHSVYIPVSALQNLRASLPAQLPQMSGGRERSLSVRTEGPNVGSLGAGLASTTSTTLGISRSSASLAGQASAASNSISFFSSGEDRGLELTE